MKPANTPHAACLALALISLLTCAFSAASAMPAAVPEKAAALDQLVADVCNRQTVLLGEDGHHGSGATSAAKVELVSRLIAECGFNAVYFESSIYDFVDFQRQLDHGSATPEMLADAIGGLWSTTSETDPLIASLFVQAKSGAVSLAGLDPTLGSATSVYTKVGLPQEITQYLAPARRKECAFEIARMTGWLYEDEQQIRDAPERLQNCAADIQRSLSGHDSLDPKGIVAVMAANFRHHLSLSADDSYNSREQAMYDNFLWYHSHQPNHTKIIVWCATVHAAKDLAFLVADRRTLGSLIHSLQKDKTATIGFSALGGSYGRNAKSMNALAMAPADSLESRAFEGQKGEQVYLDSKRLTSLGTISARALDYSKPTQAQWADVVDGMLVLREEHPVHSVRKASPQQKMPES